MSIAGEWYNVHSKSLVLHYPRGVIVHGGIIKIHSDSDDYSIHFRRFLSPIILSAFPKETGYINTPYHKWSQA